MNFPRIYFKYKNASISIGFNRSEEKWRVEWPTALTGGRFSIQTVLIQFPLSYSISEFFFFFFSIRGETLYRLGSLYRKKNACRLSLKCRSTAFVKEKKKKDGGVQRSNLFHSYFPFLCLSAPSVCRRRHFLFRGHLDRQMSLLPQSKGWVGVNVSSVHAVFWFFFLTLWYFDGTKRIGFVFF